MDQRLKRGIFAVLLGGAFSSLPWLASLTENDRVIEVMSIILLPGIIPGMAAGGGGPHDTSWAVTIWATYIFWIGIAYLGLRWRERIARQSPKP
jgi:hypothetical protein